MPKGVCGRACPSCPEDGLPLGYGQSGRMDNLLARALGGSSALPLCPQQP